VNFEHEGREGREGEERAERAERVTRVTRVTGWGWDGAAGCGGALDYGETVKVPVQV
jgi:hypothetical protein